MPSKQNQDALPRDEVLTLFLRLTLDRRKHFQSDIALDSRCSAQTVARRVEIVERHLGKGACVERGVENRRRYYRICSTTTEKGLGFSFEELEYLSFYRDVGVPYLPEHVASRIDRSLMALALHLGEVNSHPLTGAPIGFRAKGYIDYSPHLGVISTLRQAISKKQICHIQYKAHGRQSAAIYRYAPGYILAMNGTLYVQGYRLAVGSLLKERPTTFSLHRIERVLPTGEYFQFDAADADARNFGLNWHEPRRINIQIASSAGDYVRDRTWSADQTIVEQPDGGLILSVTTTSERELNAWVWSFGGAATIIPGGEVASGCSQVMRRSS
jgi:hypothetical protein